MIGVRALTLGLLLLALVVWQPAGAQQIIFPVQQCTTNQECDDGVFCNGLEICTAVNARRSVCARGPAACGTLAPGCLCLESEKQCQRPQPGCSHCEDRDGDGEICGVDCDDNDPRRYPGNVEVCDQFNFDEDCDDRTYGFRDVDGDGFDDSLCCNRQAGGKLNCGRDCDDLKASVSPMAPEVCNGFDDDCDGAVDEDVKMTLWKDKDGDGFGNGTNFADRLDNACPQDMSRGATDGGQIGGWVPNAADTDDTDAGVNPVTCRLLALGAIRNDPDNQLCGKCFGRNDCT